MSALIAKYLAQPTSANASKLVAYCHRHPFAELLMDYLEQGLLAAARAQVL